MDTTIKTTSDKTLGKMWALLGLAGAVLLIMEEHVRNPPYHPAIGISMMVIGAVTALVSCAMCCKYERRMRLAGAACPGLR